MIFKLNESQANDGYLSSAEYQKARSVRLGMDKYKCQLCGSVRNLQVHHINRSRNDNPNPYTDLITLCDNCHESVEKTIKEHTWKEGMFFYTVVSASVEPYSGSEKLEACDRLCLTLLVYSDPFSFEYVRYINDRIPITESFAWKWNEFLPSVGLNVDEIDTDSISDMVIGKTGCATFAIKNGEYGPYSVVKKYLRK